MRKRGQGLVRASRAWGDCGEFAEGRLRAYRAPMSEPTPFDLKSGVPLSALPDGAMLRGQIDGEDALLLRRGDALYAVGALCTHYHAPLADGVFEGETMRCPMHHAQFDVRTGEALCAPAFDA